MQPLCFMDVDRIETTKLKPWGLCALDNSPWRWFRQVSPLCLMDWYCNALKFTQVKEPGMLYLSPSCVAPWNPWILAWIFHELRVLWGSSQYRGHCIFCRHWAFCVIFLFYLASFKFRSSVRLCLPAFAGSLLPRRCTTTSPKDLQVSLWRSPIWCKKHQKTHETLIRRKDLSAAGWPDKTQRTSMVLLSKSFG